MHFSPCFLYRGGFAKQLIYRNSLVVALPSLSSCRVLREIRAGNPLKTIYREIANGVYRIRYSGGFTRVHVHAYTCAFAHLTLSYNLYARLEIIIHFAARRMIPKSKSKYNNFEIISAANFCHNNSFVIFPI